MASHLIHRINLLVETPDKRTADRMQHDAVELLYHDVLPQLEKILDELSPSGELICLKQIDLDTGPVDAGDFDSQFSRAVVRSFRDETDRLLKGGTDGKAGIPGEFEFREKVDGTENLEVRSEEEAVFESFVYFLETGELPWWDQSGEWVEGSRVLKLFLHGKGGLRERLSRLLVSNRTAFERLILQYPPDLVRTVLLLLIRSTTVLPEEQMKELIDGVWTAFKNQYRSSARLFSSRFSGFAAGLLQKKAIVPGDFDGLPDMLQNRQVTGTFRQDEKTSGKQVIREYFVSQEKADDPENLKIRSEEEAVFESFVYFLETGELPWWDQSGEWVEGSRVLKLFLHGKGGLRERLSRLLVSNRTAFERLILQYPPDLARAVLLVLMRSTTVLPEERMKELIEGAWTAFKKRYGSSEGLFSLRFSSFAAGLLQKKEIVPGDFDGLPDMLLNGKVDDTFRQDEKTSNGQEEYFVSHAGLVLLHPFLESLFSGAGLVAEGKFKDHDSRTMAVHLLNYLATGAENAPEFELTFEKYLCGMEISEPLQRFVQLTVPVKEECEKLLRAAVSHWKVLKNTSPDGLREGFLQRRGKLVPGDFQHRLIVERQSHDVLLAYLPWGIGLIKLPWLSQVLAVDWSL